MATGTEGFVGGVLATLAAIFVVPKMLEGRAQVPKLTQNRDPMESGYYVLQWFASSPRGKPDAVGGPWKTMDAARRYERKSNAAAKRIREPQATEVRRFSTRAAAHAARP